MKTVPWIAAGAAMLLAALVLPAAQPDRKATESQLRKLNDRIASEQQQQKKAAAEKERLNRALEDAERVVSKVSGDLSVLRNKRASLLATRQQLVQERKSRQDEHDAARADLGAQLRSAYLMGRNEPLKLLLNQRNPAEFGRNLTYYSYLGRLRASQMQIISTNIGKIDALTVRIDEEDGKLRGVESDLKAHVGQLESAQRKRGVVLANLEKETRGRAATLRDLQAERQQMEKLLKELSRRPQVVPYDPNSPFAKLQNKLPWPVNGSIAAGFGSGTRPDGIEIDADRGAEVRAIHDGKVVFADYFNNLGNLVIVDHGNGYLSIYSHNEQIFRSEGARVTGGEKIATVGDTGGRKRPGLYFELRKDGKPVDPRRWFRSNAPPQG